MSFSSPTLYLLPTCALSNFTVRSSDIHSFSVSCQLSRNTVLYPGDFFEVWLPGFSYLGSNFTNDLADTTSYGNLINEGSSVFDSSTKKLRVIVKGLVNSSVGLSFTCSNFELPVEGLSSTNHSQVQYTIGKYLTGENVPVISPRQQFGTVSDIIKVYNLNLDFQFVNHSAKLIESLVIQFDLTNYL